MADLHILKIIRPHIVAGGFLGYLLGVLLALIWEGQFSPTMFALGYLVVLFMDLASHYSNDYFDVNLDKNSPRKTFGGSYVLVDHPEVRPLAGIVAIVLSATSLIIASTMVRFLGSPPIFLILAGITNLLGWLYSAPPARLNARGLGEVTIAIGTGFSIPALGYMAISGVITQPLVFFLVPMTLYGFILALTLEIPDLEVDRANNRKNIVVHLGRRPITFLALLLSVSATLIFVLFASVISPLFWAVPVISVAPIIAELMGISMHSRKSTEGNQIDSMNISALFLFLVSLDGYLMVLLVW